MQQLLQVLGYCRQLLHIPNTNASDMLPAKLIDTMQHAGRFTLHLASLLLTHLSNMLPM